MSGTSPRQPAGAETVGDVLRTRSPRSKVIGISGKDRGAILPPDSWHGLHVYVGSGEFASTTRTT